MSQLSLEVTRPTAKQPRLPQLLFFALLAIVALAPLPLGGNRPWAWEMLGAVVGLVLALAGFNQLLHPAWYRSVAPLKIPAVLFAIVIGWATVQCLPFTPEAWQHPLWTQATDYLGPHILTSISIDRVASISHLFRLITYAAIFWLSYTFCLETQRARITMKAVILIVCLYAAWGLAVYWTGNATILWFKKWAYISDLTGTFVNRNSFATFLGLGLLTAIALILEAMHKRIDFRESRRGVLKATIEVLAVHSRWLTIGCVGMATALLLTHSRGGSISTLFGLFAFLFATNRAPRLRASWHRHFGFGLIVALLVMWGLSDNVMTERLVDGAFEPDARISIFSLTLRAIHDWPLFGTGLGSFRDIFPLYRTEDLPLIIAQAHNDYLETIVELGLPAALLLFVAIGSVLWICIRGVVRRRRDAIFSCIGVGATTLIGIHSLFDFSLQMPGVTSLYWLLMGAAVAQSFNSTSTE